jgi:hypothetical protein
MLLLCLGRGVPAGLAAAEAHNQQQQGCTAEDTATGTSALLQISV